MTGNTPNRDSGPASGGKIGPNAIIRALEAITALEGSHGAARIFEAASLTGYLTAPPQAMVPEAEVAALFRALNEVVGPQRAHTISWIAGHRTADYLLERRIPAFAQRLLRLLPAGLAARVLVVAVTRHAWTFAGSGSLSVQHGDKLEIVMTSCPLCRGTVATAPMCTAFAATFERLFAELVRADTRVAETTCAATGAPACTFEIAWRRRRSPVRVQALPA